MLSNWLRGRIQNYCTSACHLCGLTIERRNSNSIWCDDCTRYFMSEPRCQCCGLTTIKVVEKCGRCLKEPPEWNRLYCVGDYQFPLSKYVSQLKYQNNYQVAFDLTYLLSQTIDEPAPTLIPVPLHWKRQIWRGYNQSEVLASSLSRQLPMQPKVTTNVFRRTKSTPPQQGLGSDERQRNMMGAFSLKTIPESSHVAIVDDVVTTGSTVRHLCNLLLEYEVEKIDIYCICRTPEPDR